MIKKVIILALILNISCTTNTKKSEAQKVTEAVFVAVDSKVSKLEFSNDLYPTGDLNIIEYLYYYNGGGVALGDINNDGLDDIYLTANQKPDKLYLNKGNLTFKDISVPAKISKDSTWSTGVTMADVNADGLLDIYVCKVGNYKGLKAKNELYINTGNNTFKEDAKSYGLDFAGFSTQASFFDYDNDGDLDMYLLNHSVHSNNSYGNAKLRQTSSALAGDVLFENTSETGVIAFVDVTKKAGIYNSALGYGLAIATSDVNNDGLMDIYVGNDFHENDYLYINNGNKTFTESSKSYFNHTSRFTMGVDIADINNSNKLDVLTLDMMPYNAEVFLKSGGEDSDKVNQIKRDFGFQQQYARNHLQINTGTSFKDVALLTNTYATDWSWSPLVLDFNNDGLKDIYITNGIYKRPNDLDYINYTSTVNFAKYSKSLQDTLEQKLIETMPTLNLQNAIFKNNGNLEFTKLKTSLNKTYSNGAAYSDLDKDGDLDLVVNNINSTVTLLENTTTNSNYANITLVGDAKYSNTNGAKVYLHTGNKTLYKEQTTVRGFMSSSTKQLHFGLGKQTKIDSITVIWPDATKSTTTNVASNVHVVIKKTNTTAYTYKNNTEKTYNYFKYAHKENTFLDYEKEPLMPEQLSLEGPSVVQEDFNADGLKDLFIGGARNQAPVLFLQTKQGQFIEKNNSFFADDSLYEDTDAVAFDIDNDGDLDIYALSGGNDYKEGDPMLEDRVYVNDGAANFTKLNATLLATNGGSVSTADFNKDGLADLFIGNRAIPNAYGLTPFSFILQNTGNSNFKIADKKRFGMVTDSQWADLDNDGAIELIIAGDWMPIRVFSYNNKGGFTNKTKDFGLENTNGMWNVIKIADVNNDNKLDIIAGNVGLNFKWKASKDSPVTMYLDDFDKNNTLDQIIFYNFFGTNVPFASKDKLITQLPILKKTFLKYATFSRVTAITDLNLKPTADILETKHLYELRSMAFLSNTTAKFTAQPLPKEAQQSTIEDVFIDKNTVTYTGNFKGFVTELGNSSSNSGGVFTIANSNMMHTKYLELPEQFSGRKIVPLTKDAYLFLQNNGTAIKLKKEN